MKKLILLALVFCSIGCKKHTVTKPVPAIVITTPADNQHFVKGDTIHITGTVTHSTELAEVAVHMTDLSTKVEFFHNHFSTGSLLTYNFNSSYPIQDNIKTSFNVEVEAVDINGNKGTKEITILIN